MSLTRILPAGLLAGLLLAAWPLPAPAQPDTKPAIAPADANVPQSAMGELEQTFQPKQQPTSREEALVRDFLIPQDWAAVQP